MKGFIIKDFCLLKEQKNTWIFFALISLIFGFSGTEPSIITSYLTFMASMLVLSTISYDSYDNGMGFLMTLPITRKKYAASKYCFGFMVTAAGCLISSLLAAAVALLRFGEVSWKTLLAVGVSILAICVLVMCLMIPIQIKYGAEKGRIVMMGAVGITVLVCFAVVWLGKAAGVGLEDVAAVIRHLGITGIILIFIVVLAVCLYISFRCSQHIMNKKEF